MKVNDDAPRKKSSSNIVHSRYYDEKNRLPKEVDFLFAYSTLEGYESYRDEDNGTWYIQMLCKAIREEESKDIFAILTYTHSLISQMVGKFRDKNDEIVEVKMASTFESRLTKLFYIAEPQNSNEKVRINLITQIDVKNLSL